MNSEKKKCPMCFYIREISEFEVDGKIKRQCNQCQPNRVVTNRVAKKTLDKTEPRKIQEFRDFGASIYC